MGTRARRVQGEAPCPISAQALPVQDWGHWRVFVGLGGPELSGEARGARSCLAHLWQGAYTALRFSEGKRWGPRWWETGS